MKKTSNLGHFFLQVLSIMQIGYLPKIEFGIKAALNVILAKDSWILALLVMDQTVKSIVPVSKNFEMFNFKPRKSNKNRHNF